MLRILYENKVYDFDVRVIPNTLVENWVRFKIYPVSPESYDAARQLLNAEEALIIWKKDTDHFFSTNAVLVLNQDLLEIIGSRVIKEIVPIYIAS